MLMEKRKKIFVPPIKCQGIKTRLVSWILAQVRLSDEGRWIEPFLGSGVVGFNLRPEKAVFADVNPHIIRFYRAIQTGDVTVAAARRHLEMEGARLAQDGESHFYWIRERFNSEAHPLDFLFLNRSCFNGVMRFNRQGHFNVSFGRKPTRFSKAYVTKICNQIEYVARCAQTYDWRFVCADFRDVVGGVSEKDFVYCDPPYLGRHTDYFSGWSKMDDRNLRERLLASQARFIISTWHSSGHRENSSIHTEWAGHPMLLQEHFYHVGANETNRNSVLEALVLSHGLQAESSPVACVSERGESCWL